MGNLRQKYTDEEWDELMKPTNNLKRDIRPTRLLEAIDAYFIGNTRIITLGRVYSPQAVSSASFVVVGDDNEPHEFFYGEAKDIFKVITGRRADPNNEPIDFCVYMTGYTREFVENRYKKWKAGNHLI